MIPHGSIRDEGGWAVVTVLAVMGLMLVLSLSAFASVDTQTRQSGLERQRENSFALAEGVMTAQIFSLSRSWPGTASGAYPASCVPGATNRGCPDAATIARSFDGVDYAAETSWVTSVRDNGATAANFYSDSITNAQPAWDANRDGRLWVRAQARVRGRVRTLVALVKVEVVNEGFPRNAITAGRFGTTNRGNKVIVDTKGPSAQASPLAVRCRQRDAYCLDYVANKGQVWPDTTQVGYSGGNALTDDALERFRSRAIADGTYSEVGCPANPSGAVVFIENGDCSYNNSAGACCNVNGEPGVLILARGTVSFGGNIEFYGVVYAANQQASTDVVVSIQGTASIRGAVAIDGGGKLSAGSSKANVVYDENVFSSLRSYGTAGIIQNTWREIPSG